MSKRHRLNDPVLVFLYRDLQQRNKHVPQEERQGFQAYCRSLGILAPEDWESIRRFEVSMDAMEELDA